MIWDYLIVGAGITGATCARLLAERDKTCLVIDKRDHIGGNCYDFIDESGILTHAYGPHHFHTNNKKVVNFLDRFTRWTNTFLRVRCLVNGIYYYFPFSLFTLEQLTGKPSSVNDMIEYLDKHRVPYDNPQNSEELVLSRVGLDIFEMFYDGYTRKMWGMPANCLDASVCGRIPVYKTWDDRYFQDDFQGIPDKGYTTLFDNMLNHPKIKYLINCDLRYNKSSFKYKHMIYTGPIDEYYNYTCGHLPYRSLVFEYGEPMCGVKQPVCQINYPDFNIPYTRTVEYKHLTRQITPFTRIITEFPQAYSGKNEPYYPIPSKDNHAIYHNYLAFARIEHNITFAGRLGSYQYLNMDKSVEHAFDIIEKLEGNKHE